MRDFFEEFLGVLKIFKHSLSLQGIKHSHRELNIMNTQCYKDYMKQREINNIYSIFSLETFGSIVHRKQQKLQEKSFLL